jgi:putative heme-binding domain-containing protein
MLSELLQQPGDSAGLLPALAQSVAASRDEPELARALTFAANSPPETQAVLLNGLAKGRKNALRTPLGNASARKTLAGFCCSPAEPVRAAAHTLEDTFVPVVADDAALAAQRQVARCGNRQRGNLPKVRRRACWPARASSAVMRCLCRQCATCHRVGSEGYDVGPDLIGQLAVAEEGLLKDILMPNERIRPGYETTLVQMADGSAVIGILKDDAATSLTLASAGGVEQALLRKDVTGVRRLATSLMPSFAETLSPIDVANLLSWLKSNLNAPGGVQVREMVK